jgi:hypothetical protein
MNFTELQKLNIKVMVPGAPDFIPGPNKQRRFEMGLLNLSYVFIGIDPGAQGAIAVLDSRSNVIQVEDWAGDEIMMAAWMRDFLTSGTIREIHAAIEYASSMPGQGVSSVFKYGTNYGIWRGILAANRIPFEIVFIPRDWSSLEGEVQEFPVSLLLCPTRPSFGSNLGRVIENATTKVPVMYAS